MDNQKIIIALLVIIIAILVVGVLILSPFGAKEDTNLAISKEKINEGDSFAVKLTDGKGNAIANATVTVKFTDKEGTVTEKNITTNSNGNAKFNMKDDGKYSVECIFDGDNKYASSSTVGNLTVKKFKQKLLVSNLQAQPPHQLQMMSGSMVLVREVPTIQAFTGRETKELDMQNTITKKQVKLGAATI